LPVELTEGEAAKQTEGVGKGETSMAALLSLVVISRSMALKQRED
jgi:hypothetical protein